MKSIPQRTLLGGLLPLLLLGCGGGGGDGAAAGNGGSTPPPPHQASWQQASQVAIPYTGTTVASATWQVPGEDAAYVMYSGSNEFWNGNFNPIQLVVAKVTPDNKVQDVTQQILPASIQNSRILIRDIRVVDVNGDGYPDLFIGAYGRDDLANANGEAQALLIWDPATHAFKDASSSLPPIVSTTHSLAVGDIDGDGKPDILVGVLGQTINANLPAQYYGPNVVGNPAVGGPWVGPYVLKAQANGQLQYDNTILPAEVSNPSLASSDHPGRFLSAAWVDVNGDGKPDLVLGSDFNSQSAGAIWLNDGHGHFNGQPISLPPGLYGALNTNTVQIQTLPLAGSDQPGLILSQTAQNPYYQSGRLQVLKNLGKGLAWQDVTKQVMPGGQFERWIPYFYQTDMQGKGGNDIVVNLGGTGDALTGHDSSVLLNQNGVYQPMPLSTALKTQMQMAVPVTVGQHKVLVGAVSDPNQKRITISSYAYY